MGGLQHAAAVAALELQHHDLTYTIALEPFIGIGRMGDIAAQALEFPALMAAQLSAAQVCVSSDHKGVKAAGADAPTKSYAPEHWKNKRRFP